MQQGYDLTVTLWDKYDLCNWWLRREKQESTWGILPNDYQWLWWPCDPENILDFLSIGLYSVFTIWKSNSGVKRVWLGFGGE